MGAFYHPIQPAFCVRILGFIIVAESNVTENERRLSVGLCYVQPSHQEMFQSGTQRYAVVLSTGFRQFLSRISASVQEVFQTLYQPISL